MADWRNELSGIIGGKARVTRAEQENALFEDFLDTVALPALTEVAEELNGKHGRDAQVRRAPHRVGAAREMECEGCSPDIVELHDQIADQRTVPFTLQPIREPCLGAVGVPVGARAKQIHDVSAYI